MQELDEGLLQLAEVAAVSAHVVGVDIGHHRDHRLQVQETGVAFVRLGDQVTAAAQLRIGAGGGQAPADDECRVQATGSEHRSQQAGGGGLAMGAGHGDTMAVTHQFGEHLGTRHHRDTLFERQRHFRVGRVDRAGYHQHIGARDVAGLVTDEDLRTELLQALGAGRFLEIGAGHLVTEVEQYFGDAAHADAADADEMDAPNAPHAAHFGLHGCGRLSHAPPPDRYRRRYGWHRVGTADAQSSPWP